MSSLLTTKMNQRSDTKGQRLRTVHLDQRSRQPKRSMTESVSNGTSKLLSFMAAKKDVFINDLSSRLGNSFSLKSDTSCNSSDSDESDTPPVSPEHRYNNPSSQQHVRETSCKSNSDITRRYSSTESFHDNSKSCIPRIVSVSKHSHFSKRGGPPSLKKFSVNGMNISFDEPMYNKPDLISSTPIKNIPVSDGVPCQTRTTAFKYNSASRPTSIHPKLAVTANKKESLDNHLSLPPGNGNCIHYRNDASTKYSVTIGEENDQLKHVSTDLKNQILEHHNNKTFEVKTEKNWQDNNLKESRNKYFEENLTQNKEKASTDSSKTCSNKFDNDSNRNSTNKMANESHRTNPFDKIFDDDVIKTDCSTAREDDSESTRSIGLDLTLLQSTQRNSSSCELKASGAIDNSESPAVDSASAVVHRTVSFGSEKSWSSVYSVDSQPDDVTIECMSFMKVFVGKVFDCSENISQTEKAKFGELCQHFPGRLWFSRYVSSQRVHHKRVPETVFFRLMQFFAVCLFECHEADDFSPAKTLMNMCFTFNHEEQGEKIFLYMRMKEQPIWRSLRFWNAAYFDAVQCERSRQPMATNSDQSEIVSDDNKFQENITFGQLGTFVSNMRDFGLSKELCLEFLRKQCTIANLGKEQVQLLRETVERQEIS